MTPPAADDSDEAVRLEMDRLARQLDGRLRKDALRSGCYLERPHLPKPWAMSAFFEDAHSRSEVEFTIVPERVIDQASQRRDFQAWLDARAHELGVRASAARSKKLPAGTWHGGFTRRNALQLLRQLRQRLDPMNPTRWASESVAPPADPLDQAVSAMVRSARSAAAQSGQARTEVAKTKEVRFASDAVFEAHLRAMLAQQQGRCCLSGLPLQMAPDGASDADMRASLDRIDPDGHYEAGNLQIVCWFLNRWKNDDSNANFMRLLQAVRTAPAPRGDSG